MERINKESFEEIIEKLNEDYANAFVYHSYIEQLKKNIGLYS